MGCLNLREKNEFCLEEDHHDGQHRWIALEVDRIGSGVVNPTSYEEVFRQDRLVLELVPYMLGVSHLDVHSLDVTFAMDFDYMGSHDEVIAEALFSGSAFNCLLDLPSAKPIVFSPTIVVALSDDELTQARISVESKTSVFEPGEKRQNPDNAISLSLTIRRYPQTGTQFDMLKSFEYQCRLAEELMAEKIVPNFVQPLTETIAQKRLI